MNLKPAFVYWRDAESIRKDYLPKECPLMTSIGLVEKRKSYYLIVTLLPPEYQEDMYNACSTIVPLGCVEKVEYLYEKKTNKRNPKNHRKSMAKVSKS